ncbi:hypothetical protein MC7420_4954 [Coleofasciculus chthonoplastes PCC 7420]|uniref:Uncharacterized protein n=1 Tax=Coleofasciculus chthonoplastes PCC 7420 TaxID=118168 RepID=B4VZ79_9CYAN|nr:hypothetical protein MC7420_4954 [Coleofasciculus chthonoplastes PCC 7420]
MNVPIPIFKITYWVYIHIQSESAHADNLPSKMARTKFEQNPGLIGSGQRETLNGVSGTVV